MTGSTSRPSNRDTSVAELVSAAREGNARAVARLISIVEHASPDESRIREVSAALSRLTGKAHVIGVTGPPGVGKSTSTAALVSVLRKSGKRVGVLAVDPSSTFSGGALLGDRIRMQEHATDPDVFIRSMASRGHLGGLSWATPQAIRVLDAARCDFVIVETVGVGQSEVEISGLADTTLVLLAPGMGDGIQAAKAGILEIGDIFVVNKADREGANTTRREIRTMISHTQRAEETWKPPVVLTIASESDGIDKVARHITEHRSSMERTGELQVRREARVRREIEAIALARVQQSFSTFSGDRRLGALAEAVLRGEDDPLNAADVLLDGLKEP